MKWLNIASLALAAGLVLLPRDAAAPPFDETSQFDNWLEMERSLDRVTVVVVDAGHGGQDAGITAGGLTEAKLAQALADDAARRIRRELGARVVLTRQEDRHLTPSERVAVANQARGDLLISIHAGASPAPDTRGIAVYYPARYAGPSRIKHRTSDGIPLISWKEATETQRTESQRFAQLVADATTEATELPLLGIYPAPLGPLQGATMPAVLVEVGMLTNEEDAAALGDERLQALLADALREAVLEYDQSLDRRPR